jgi:hypothetical protein
MRFEFVEIDKRNTSEAKAWMLLWCDGAAEAVTFRSWRCKQEADSLRE